MTVRRWASLATLLLACGSSGKEPRCERSEDCKDGKVCIVSVEGEAGVCAVPGYGVTLVAPAAGAKVNASGVDVKVQVQLASPDGLPPSHVRARSRRGVSRTGESESCELSLSRQDGALLTYEGRCLAQTGYAGAMALWGEAETSAGALLTDAVLLEVDGIPPAFPTGGGTVACASAPACLRDEEIEVSIYVKDDNLRSVEASLDLEGSPTSVPLQPTGEFIPLRGGERYAARVPLKSLSFPRFSGTLSARIRATDEAENESAVDLPPKTVTRLRWEYDAHADGITSPAIDENGNLFFGAAGTVDQLRAVSPDGAELWQPKTVGTKGIASAPSIGSNTIWVGSEDGKLYGLKTDGTLLGSCSGQQAGSLFTPAVRVIGTDPPSEAAYTAGATALLYGAASSAGGCLFTPTDTTDRATTSPLLLRGALFLATTKGGFASLRRYSDAGVEGPSVALVCGTVTAPLTADADGHILVACGTTEIKRVEHDTLAVTDVAILSDAAQESIVILPSKDGPGDLIVGTNDGNLHRLAPPASSSGEWTDGWKDGSTNVRIPNLGAAITGTLVAKPAEDGTVVYAVTAHGDLYAVDAFGKTVWSTAGDLGPYSLTFPTIARAQQPSGLPTLYVGSAEGKLYAVVVDTDLDTSSPWPKSHRDIKNTSNADLPTP